MSLRPTAASKSAAYTGTAGNTADFTGNTGGTDVVVWSTTDCYVKVGNAVTADATTFPIPAGFPVKLAVPDGDATWRVSALRVSADGTIYAQPVAR